VVDDAPAVIADLQLVIAVIPDVGGIAGPLAPLAQLVGDLIHELNEALEVMNWERPMSL